MKYIKKLKSNKGMSLIEVMIIVSVMSLLMVGLTSIYTGIAERQRLTETKSGLVEFSKNLQEILKNEAHWRATVYAASNTGIANLSCLRDATANCVNNNNASDFDVYTENGVLIYQSSLATNGIDYTGANCVGHPSVACPFRYDLTLVTQCLDGTANCARPQVTIIGNLEIAPAALNNSVTRKLDARLAAIAPPFLPNDVIPGNSFRISRGEKARSETFELVQRSSLVGATAVIPPASGGGVCVANNWTPRPLEALTYDEGGYVTFNNAADTFSVPPGVYNCSVSAEGFDQIQGFKIRLNDMTTAANSKIIGSAITQNDASAIISGQVTMQLSQPVNVLRLEQYCGQVSDFTTPPASDMGRPVADYTNQVVFTRILCIRTL